MRSAVVENRLGNTVWTAVIYSTGTTYPCLRRFGHLSYFDKVQFRDFLTNIFKFSVNEGSCLLVPKYPCPVHEYPATEGNEVVDRQL